MAEAQPFQLDGPPDAEDEVATDIEDVGHDEHDRDDHALTEQVDWDPSSGIEAP